RFTLQMNESGPGSATDTPFERPEYALIRRDLEISFKEKAVASRASPETRALVQKTMEAAKRDYRGHLYSVLENQIPLF
ncbi:hypothetical protein HDU98_002642, partial [Podochytrium sp. JEL0797]